MPGYRVFSDLVISGGREEGEKLMYRGISDIVPQGYRRDHQERRAEEHPIPQGWTQYGPASLPSPCRKGGAETALD